MGPARFRGAKGGRGSGKTRGFAKMSAVIGAKAAAEGREGVILCGRQFMNSLADSSFSEVAAAIRSDEWLASVYEIGETFIRTRDRRVEYVFVGLARNLSSIKSKARIILCWIDEAEDVSEAAWVVLIPTVREDGSEIWVTWNPKRRGSATDLRFSKPKDDDVRIVELNWRDNPWFPAVLEAERQRDLRDRPEQCDHIWEGGYATISVGAYYAAQLLQAQNQGRIRQTLAADPLLTIKSHHDIGGKGAKADAYSIWISQDIGEEIRILDHYTAQGQPLGAHVTWMRQRGYQNAEVVLPHDGENEGGPQDSWADAWTAAKFSVRVIPNQGMGAAMFRIEQSRRWFPRVVFHGPNTEIGRTSLGMYAPNIRETDGADMGPKHDMFSHDADAFGLKMCDYVPPRANVGRLQIPTYGAV